MGTLVFILIAVTTAIPHVSAQRAINAVCVMSNGNVHGSIRLRQGPFGAFTTIAGVIRGLSFGLHGLHVHEFGNIFPCEAAGGHYNPTEEIHGNPNDRRRPFHVGDLGNIRANRRGVSRFRILSRVIKLSGPESVLGRSLVVHQNRDDLGLGGNFSSLTNGNSGARVGCCFIRLV